MKKLILKVTIFLMLISGGHTARHHEHIHYELPEWEVIADSTIQTSGTTSSEYCYFRGHKEV